MFISQPPCGDACMIGPDQPPVSALTTNPGTSSAHAVHVQQDQLGKQYDHNRHGDGNERFVGEISACMPAVIASASMPGASIESGQMGRHSRTSAIQDSRPAQQKQQPSKAMQHEHQLITVPLKHEGVGGLCRKPGRGDTTLSMSCSDKLARWALLGIQVRLSAWLTWGCIQVCCTSLQTLFACNTWYRPLSVGRPMFRVQDLSKCPAGPGMPSVAANDSG